MRLTFCLMALHLAGCQPSTLPRSSLSAFSTNQKSELLNGTWYEATRSPCDEIDSSSGCTGSWKYAMNFYETRYVQRIVDENGMTQYSPKTLNLTFTGPNTFLKSTGSSGTFEIHGNQLEICFDINECYLLSR